MSAIYLQIQKDLLHKIETGVYPAGDTIPAETILAKEYTSQSSYSTTSYLFVK